MLPVLVAVADPDDEDLTLIVQGVDDEMGFHRVDANGRVDLGSLVCRLGVGGQKPEGLFQETMVSTNEFISKATLSLLCQRSWQGAGAPVQSSCIKRRERRQGR